jgi:hypothetical protein
MLAGSFRHLARTATCGRPGQSVAAKGRFAAPPSARCFKPRPAWHIRITRSRSPVQFLRCAARRCRNVSSAAGSTGRTPYSGSVEELRHAVAGPTATRDMSATKAASLTKRGLDEQRLAIVAARIGSEHLALVSILLALHSSPDRWAEEERVRRGYLVDGFVGRSHNRACSGVSPSPCWSACPCGRWQVPWVRCPDTTADHVLPASRRVRRTPLRMRTAPMRIAMRRRRSVSVPMALPGLAGSRSCTSKFQASHAAKTPALSIAGMCPGGSPRRVVRTCSTSRS